MNYNDQIQENKAFNLFKQLMYNLALSVCIILLIALLLIKFGNLQMYEVLSDSQYPVFKTGDMVIVKRQNDYEVGDIINFQTSFNAVHRLIAKLEANGTTYYICHGDNVQSAISKADYEEYGYGEYPDSSLVDWHVDSDYINYLFSEEGGNKSISDIVGDINLEGIVGNVQVMQKDKIKGKVVATAKSYGTYIKIIKDHYMLFIALIAGIWCITTVVQDELTIKKARRLI